MILFLTLCYVALLALLAAVLCLLLGILLAVAAPSEKEPPP